MPASTKTKTDEPDTPAVGDQLADDVASETVEYPEGAPELRAVHQIPRRDRPAYYEAMAEVAKYQQTGSKAAVNPEADDRPMEVKLEAVADQYRLLVAIEDLLASVAVDEPAFRVWALEVDDSVLTRTFNAYIRKTQPGEAQSSAG